MPTLIGAPSGKIGTSILFNQETSHIALTPLSTPYTRLTLSCYTGFKVESHQWAEAHFFIAVEQNETGGRHFEN
jgi:hypothetical protein